MPKEATAESELTAVGTPREKRTAWSLYLALVAIVISIFALGASAAALVAATRQQATTETAGSVAPDSSLDEDADASEITEPTPPVSESPGQASSSVDEATDDSDEPLALSPVGEYQLVYESEEITLNPVGSGCGGRYVDLDQPLVGNDRKTGDISYYHCTNYAAPQLEFMDARLASMPSADVSPKECMERIGSAPTDVEVTPSQDLALCAVSNGIGAPNQPQRRKVVLVVINAVTETGVVNLTSTAWNIPR